jgi:hypothetical protein
MILLLLVGCLLSPATAQTQSKKQDDLSIQRGADAGPAIPTMKAEGKVYFLEHVLALGGAVLILVIAGAPGRKAYMSQ